MVESIPHMVPKRLGAELLAEFLETLVLILFGNGVVAMGALGSGVPGEVVKGGFITSKGWGWASPRPMLRASQRIIVVSVALAIFAASVKKVIHTLGKRRAAPPPWCSGTTGRRREGSSGGETASIFTRLAFSAPCWFLDQASARRCWGLILAIWTNQHPRARTSPDDRPGVVAIFRLAGCTATPSTPLVTLGRGCSRC
jgi:hypothetical protein